MNKTIWFDMDGTIYDLYKIPNWLEMLVDKKDYNVYNIDGYERPNLARIRSAVQALIANGWRVGVITWAGKEIAQGSLAMYETGIAKRDWLEKNLPELLWDFYCIPYGESKADYLIGFCGWEHGSINYLVDDNKDVRKDWRAHGDNFRTINASRAFYRELEGLAG